MSAIKFLANSFHSKQLLQQQQLQKHSAEDNNDFRDKFESMNNLAN
jgi:hypothetical protein